MSPRKSADEILREVREEEKVNVSSQETSEQKIVREVRDDIDRVGEVLTALDRGNYSTFPTYHEKYKGLRIDLKQLNFYAIEAPRVLYYPHGFQKQSGKEYIKYILNLWLYPNKETQHSIRKYRDLAARFFFDVIEEVHKYKSIQYLSSDGMYPEQYARIFQRLKNIEKGKTAEQKGL